MKKLIPFIIAGGFFTIASCNQNKGLTQKISVNNSNDSISYFIGYDFGQNITKAEFSEDINQDIVIAALKDAIAETDPLVNLDEARMKLSERLAQKRQEQQEKMKLMGEENLKKGQEFLAQNAKKEGVITTDSGLQYEVLTKGDGPTPDKTDKVKVHYHGTTLDGKVFDSSVERGKPTSFGLNQVITGWTEGVQLMPVGSKYKFYIPADLAYGKRSPSSDIPANSTLIFEVELLEILD